MMNITKLLLVILFIISSYAQSSVAATIQSVASIQAAIDDYIALNLTSNIEYKIRHSHLDKRLKLSFCSQPLEIFNTIGSLKPGRNSIGVKCEGEKRWTIFTSVIIRQYKNVVILRQAIRRGEIFNASLIQLEKREVSTLRSGYILDPDIIIKKQATRNLSAGKVITPLNFSEAKIIKRGERVTITTSQANLSISMAGIALMDGVKGQLIKVKNSKSQQIIQGTVSRPGQIVVLF